MSKVSILFKPSRQSKINSDLTYLWYFEYKYKDLLNIDKNILKSCKKIKIDWVKYEYLWDIYEWCKKNFWQESIVIIMCSINELFDYE